MQRDHTNEKSAQAALATASPSTFQVSGAMVVTPDFAQLYRDAGGVDKPTDGVQCYGKAGYDDITVGAQVAVRDPGGKILAIGQLSGGVADGTNCSFALTVAGVPNGQTFYSVEVAHRGEIQYTAEKIREPLSLNLK